MFSAGGGDLEMKMSETNGSPRIPPKVKGHTMGYDGAKAVRGEGEERCTETVGKRLHPIWWSRSGQRDCFGCTPPGFLFARAFFRAFFGLPFLPSPSLLIISISLPIKAPSRLLATRWFDVN